MTSAFEPLTVADAAEILGCSRPGVHYLVRKGHLPTFRTPRGHRIFLKQDVEALALRRATT